MRVLERSGHGVGGAGNRNQMHMIGHEAVAQQRKTIEFGVLPEQLQIGDTVGVIGQDYLPRVATLRNMMGDVNDHDARQAGHVRKPSRSEATVERKGSS